MGYRLTVLLCPLLCPRKRADRGECSMQKIRLINEEQKVLSYWSINDHER